MNEAKIYMNRDPNFIIGPLDNEYEPGEILCSKYGELVALKPDGVSTIAPGTGRGTPHPPRIEVKHDNAWRAIRREEFDKLDPEEQLRRMK